MSHFRITYSIFHELEAKICHKKHHFVLLYCNIRNKHFYNRIVFCSFSFCLNANDLWQRDCYDLLIAFYFINKLHVAVEERRWGMLFHPDKCNILHVKRSVNLQYQGTYLEAVNTAKYIGVADLSNNLSWNSRIDRTVKKENNMLGFLRRNLRINNRLLKAAAYKTLIRPNLEYCASVWSPYTATGKRKVEMVQRRAARYGTNRYHNTSSVTDMSQKTGMGNTRIKESQNTTDPACSLK